MYEYKPGTEPRQQVFELYAKMARGEKLEPFEWEIANGMGLNSKIPDDKAHEGVDLMNARKINKAQLMDCYVCHR